MQRGDGTGGTVVAVLSGGHSRRMAGRSKAALPLAGTTVLERMLTTAGDLGLPRVLVGAHATLAEDPALTGLFTRTGLPLIRDGRPDSGPLGGLEAVFATLAPERVLLLACDLPFLTPAFLTWLLEQGGQSHSVVPLDGKGRLHTLCAVYQKSCGAHLKQALDEGRLRLQDFVRAIGARQLPPAAWAELDPDGHLLTNLNESADYDAAKRWLADEESPD
ncbi:MAG TPA: molybdenum cofactor guanylyltransferase [Candidatus Latescibacteria bacterium]|nr:molybdenum cofactor guanylyltransferase [Candidatus Latescibacterota bacterium]HJP33148.1 molybdenum cofactor guanylyltransferase [Candidatus Latescibacterota bacterium]